jgi:hypothetical protein
MSVQRKASKEASPERVQEGINAGVNHLYSRHADAIEAIRRRSEDECITVNFAVDINGSESEPSISVGIRYTESHTDKVVSKLPPKGQEVFEFISPAKAKEAAAKADEARAAETNKRVKVVVKKSAAPATSEGGE